MNISMWTSYLWVLSPEEAIQTLKQHGFNHAELSDEHAKTLLARSDDTVKTGREFKQFCDSLDFKLHQAHFSLLANLDETDREKRAALIADLKRWCDLFNALDVKAGVLHPAGVKTVGSDNKQLIATALEELLNYSRNMSFSICLENLITSFPQFEDIDALIRLIPSNERLGICLDTGHLAINGGACDEFVRKAGNRLKALHITDCVDRKTDHILPYGAGNIEWEKLIHALKEISYDGLFNFEVPRERTCPYPILLKKLDYSLELAKLMLEL